MRKSPHRDLRAQPPGALLSVDEIVRPAGPAPYGKSKFLSLVRAGEAPQPVMRGRRCTRWKLSDVNDWLDRLAERGA